MTASLIITTPVLVGGSQVGGDDSALAIVQDRGTRVVAEIGEALAIVRASPNAIVMRADAVSPRFVNAHTHLDLSTYPAIECDFPDFVSELIKHRRAHPQARGPVAARHGLQQLVSQHVSAIGDIIARESVMDCELRSSPLPGVAYWEVVCTQQAWSAQTNASLSARLQAWRKLQRSAGPVVGIAPQSPYLVCKNVLQHLARVSIAEGVPLQIHAAESPSELEFFQTGSGALAQMLSASGFRVPPSPASLGFRPDSALTPIRYLADIGFLDAAPTLVHCVNVTDEDIRIIAEHNCPVVTCPRSNANLNCGVFPWEKFAKAGVSIALATDSVASAHSLNLHSELDAALLRYGSHFNVATALEWLTSGGDRALRRPSSVIKAGCNVDDLVLLNLRPGPALHQAAR